MRLKKVCLLWEKCLFGEKVLILGSGGFRILSIVKLPKNVKFRPALQHFSKIIKNIVLNDSTVEKIQAIYFPKSSYSPNKHIFVKTKRVCLLWKKCLL